LKTSIDLQDNYLKLVTAERIPVVIYLVNGVQLRGLVCGFDNFTILLENEGRQEMIYKHAVSTISPQKPIQLKLE
jgi:host factor-I protein